MRDVIIALSVLSSVWAHARPVCNSSKIDPLIFRSHALNERLPANHRLRSTLPLAKDGKTQVTIRLRQPANATVRALLAQRGVTLDRRHVGAVYPATVQLDRVCDLGQSKHIVRVESAWLPWAPATLDLATTQVQTAPLAALVYAKSGLMPGQGITIGNLDSGVDIHHPGLFRADGGAFAWIDQNQNGVLDPGIDGVDLDGDHSLGQGELLQFIDSDLHHTSTVKPFGTYNPAQIQPLNGTFEPRFDWLYVDTNNNGSRDYGAGFVEADPAYGEPIFVADDLNADGIVSTNEKLLRLSTSKLKGIAFGNQTFTRGQNLIDAAAHFKPELVYHGTGTMGILAGGHPGGGRYTGLAPYADLLLLSTGVSTANLIANTSWAQSQGMNVLLVEFGSWVLHFLDGSSNLEFALDELSKQGVAVITPSGNLGSRGKHFQVDAAKGYTEIPFHIPGFYKDTGDPQNISTVICTLLWRTAKSGLSVELESPGGVVIGLPGAGSVSKSSGEGWTASGDGQASIRQTYRLDIIATADGGKTALPYGDWILRLGNPKSKALTVHGYIKDDVHSFHGGIKFLSHTTDYGTASWPSTADKSITVGAYGGRFAAAGDNGPGKLRVYSGRGPRIDGEILLDVLAPDDSITLGAGTTLHKDLSYGGYEVFAGTSGAAPHVAAAAALMLQLDPELTPDKIRQSLRDGALAEPWMGDLPHPAFGYGKLRAFKAATGAPPQTLLPPTPSMTVAEKPGLVRVLDFSESTDGTGESAGLKYRFDLTYSGQWDSDLTQKPTAEVTFPSEGEFVVKVEVVDALGSKAAALFPVAISWIDAPVDDPKPADTVVVAESAAAPEPLTVENVAEPAPDAATSGPEPGTVPDPEKAAQRDGSGGCSQANHPVFPPGVLGLLAALLLVKTRRRHGLLWLIR